MKGFTCDTALCKTATHNLQKEALERMIKVVLKAVIQQIQGPFEPAWLPYFDMHFTKLDFENEAFDSADENRLFQLVLTKIQEAPVLYVQPHSKCDKRSEAFFRPLKDVLNMVSCESVQKAIANDDIALAEIVSITESESGKKLKIQFNLARAPVPPSVFLKLEYCRFTCDDIRRKLFLDPLIHRQLISQILKPMPPFLGRSLSVGSKLTNPTSASTSSSSSAEQPFARREGVASFFESSF
jgi:hypothetical protein